MRVSRLVLNLLLASIIVAVESRKKTKPPTQPNSTKQEHPPDENDPNQAFLSYGNNPLHDAARDGNLDLVRKIVNRVPGVFRDARFSKWEYDDPEDYPDLRDKNDVIA
jgi:hypothetical protein